MLHSVSFFGAQTMAMWMPVEILLPTSVSGPPCSTFCHAYLFKTDKEEGTERRLVVRKSKNVIRPDILVNETKSMDIADRFGQLFRNLETVGECMINP